MVVVLRLKRGEFIFGLNVNFCFKIQRIPKVDVGREFLYFSLFIIIKKGLAFFLVS